MKKELTEEEIQQKQARKQKVIFNLIDVGILLLLPFVAIMGVGAGLFGDVHTHHHRRR